MTRLKRLARKLVPDWLMARYRLAQYSRVVRWNMDVFFTNERDAKRFLSVTPDTVRARIWDLRSFVGGGADSEIETHRSGETVFGPAYRIPSSVDAVITGSLEKRGRFSGSRAFPRLAPIEISARPEVFQQVGGRPEGDLNLQGIYRRVQDAGFTFGVIPLGWKSRIEKRSDPISEPAVVVVSAVPLHDVGGGSRASQLALEILRRGFHVTFVSMFPASESVDLGLRFVHPRLEQIGHEEFETDLYLRRVQKPAFCLLELPIGKGVSWADALKRGGFRVVYDLIDDWSDPALGGEWYRSGVEARLVSMVDLVCASAGDLVLRLEDMGASNPLLVPNAVNSEVFGVSPTEIPEDIRGINGTIFGYHGSLYGDWFDWGALEAVANAFSDAHLIVIGDVPSSVPAMPRNVVFLGLKSQKDLPAYLARFDVGLLPFRITDTTHAVSPLKVFEYLAMGVRVAAPPLRSLNGLDGVYVDESLVGAVRSALEGEPPDRMQALAEHSWKNRVDSILGRLGVHSLDENDPVRISVRRVRHYEASERLVFERR